MTLPNAENPVAQMPKNAIKGQSGYLADVTTANELQVHVSGTSVVTVQTLSEGPIGAPIPADGTLMSGQNPSGNLEPIQLDTSNRLIDSPIGLALQSTNQVSISTVATQIIAANASRAGVVITNPGTLLTVYIGNVGVTAANGFPLAPGSSITLPVIGAVYGITSSSIQTVGYLEVQ